MSELPEIKRVAPDAVALRALAHPVRLRLLSLLRIEGPSTATALAARLGLNSGATSYHLRLLARHGFSEDDAGQGTRRERWWKASHQSTTFFEPGSSREQYEAGAAFAEAVLTAQIGLIWWVSTQWGMWRRKTRDAQAVPKRPALPDEGLEKWMGWWQLLKRLKRRRRQWRRHGQRLLRVIAARG